MVDVCNTANVIWDSSHTSGHKLIESKVYSWGPAKKIPLWNWTPEKPIPLLQKMQHSLCWEAQSLTWWPFDLFWSFNCAPWVSEQLDMIFHTILPTKIIPLLVHSPHWSYFIAQVPSASHWLLVHRKRAVKQLVFEQLPGSAPTRRATGLLSQAVGSSSLKSIWCIGTSPGSVSPSAA